MPTVFTHMAVSVAAGKSFAPLDVPKRFWYISLICAIIPDADVIGFTYGIPYGHFLGHRGFFHSPFFGFIVSVFIMFVFFIKVTFFSKRWFFYFFFFFIMFSSHGILDAFTDGGLGIALLAPFDNTRYFFPVTPIAVSPIGLKAFLSEWGVNVIVSELKLVWFPLIIMYIAAKFVRRKIYDN